MPFLADALLALGALFSFLFVGLAALKILRLPCAGLERLAFAAALGVPLHALAGFAVALSPAKTPTACALFLVLWTISAFTLRPSRLTPSSPSTPRSPQVRQALLVLTGFILACVGATHLPVRFPPTLPDGMYVFKSHTLPVKIQLLTGGLPADNYIPFAVAEYLLRDISFTREHPLLPGQEVTNRPVLMALATTPFLAVLSPPLQTAPLPRFRYVGTGWPDVGLFAQGPAFERFLMVGIVLNALVLLGAALLFAAHGPRSLFLPGLLLLATSPFYLSQTVFTWPKLLAAFYLLLALHALTRRRHPAWIATLAALAYWAHPFAMAYLCGIGAHYAFIAWRQRHGPAPLAPLLRFSVTAALLLAPWFVWACLVLRLPSDIITQNIAGQGRGIDTLSAHVWVRLANLVHAFATDPVNFFPTDILTLFRQTISHLPGILGLLTLPAYAGLLLCFHRQRVIIVQGVLLPSALLSLPFGRPARLTWLAYHSVGVCLLLLALLVLARLPRRIALSIITAQILLQLTLLFVYGRSLA